MEQFLLNPSQRLLSCALDALKNRTAIEGRAIEIPSGVTGENVPDAMVALVLDGKFHQYRVVCRSVIDRKAQIGQIHLKLKQFSSPAILVTEYLSKELALYCRANGLQFIDTQGNAYLRAPGLYVLSVGEKGDYQQQTVKAPKGLTNAAALRVVFPLLSKSELLNATFKEIAAFSGVALGTAHNVLRDLEKLGYLLASKNRRTFLEPGRLMEEWVTNYPTTLRPKLDNRRFWSPDSFWWQKTDLTDLQAAWGGEVAAAKMFKHLSPSTQTVYVDAKQMRATITTLVKNFRIRPAPDGPIEILEKFWPADLETVPGIAPPLLVYSDLLSMLDPRTTETGALFREKFIGNMYHPG